MKKKKKCFYEELWHLFQEQIAAGDDLVDSIEKAHWKLCGTLNSPTPHMKQAVEVWKDIQKKISEEMNK